MVLQSNNTISFSNIMVEYGITQKPFGISNLNAVLGQPYNARIGLSNMFGMSANASPSLLNPVLNYDAASMASVGSGNYISQWTNTGSLGTNYNMIAYGLYSTKPTLGSSNSFYHVSFNRTYAQYFNSSNQLPLTWFNVSGVYKGVTSFVVAKYTGTPGGFERFFDFGNGPGNDSFWFGRIGTNYTLATEIYNANTNVSGWVQSNYTNDGKYHIYALNISNYSGGCAVKLYMDSTSNNIASLSFNTPINNRTCANGYIGRSEWNDAYLNAEMRQLLMYNSSLTSNDMTTVFQNLKTKWSMT